ncbi:MAG: flagellar hook-basal body complex protein FliE [Spirochaetes bacterium]|nr:flagellar hook-basal body complex protein FliE [Spirochaetota bacterium]
MNTIANTTMGTVVKMKTTHPLHFTGIKEEQKFERPTDDVAGTFADALMKAVGGVNNLMAESEELNQKMIHEPESVDIHTVMIAAQKAEIALNFTKAVRDEAIRSYRDLMNLR